MQKEPFVTIITPTIRGREDLVERCRESVRQQTLSASDLIHWVKEDEHGYGPALLRDHMLMRVQTPWVSFLDDDDEFMPGHLEVMLDAAQRTRADYLYSWYEVVGGTDPRPDEFGLPWNDAEPRQTTITTLVRTRLAQRVGGFSLTGEDEVDDLDDPSRVFHGEDWRFTLRCLDAGAKIYHLPVKTWYWHHHGRNTSGLPKNARRLYS